MDERLIEDGIFLITCLCPYLKRLAKKTNSKLDDTIVNMVCNTSMAISGELNAGKRPGNTDNGNGG